MNVIPCRIIRILNFITSQGCPRQQFVRTAMHLGTSIWMNTSMSEYADSDICMEHGTRASRTGVGDCFANDWTRKRNDKMNHPHHSIVEHGIFFLRVSRQASLVIRHVSYRGEGWFNLIGQPAHVDASGQRERTQLMSSEHTLRGSNVIYTRETTNATKLWTVFVFHRSDLQQYVHLGVRAFRYCVTVHLFDHFEP